MKKFLLIALLAIFTIVGCEDVPPPVSSVKIDQTSFSLPEGGTGTLTVTVQPENARDKTVTWSSSDETVVKVDPATGKLTAVGPGEATITATTNDGNKVATCVVTIDAIPSAVTIEPNIGNKGTLKAIILPENAKDKTVTWSSGNEKIAKVDPATGEVTAVAVGEVTITAATSTKGVTATCPVTVRAAEVPAESVTLEPKELKLAVGEIESLTATVLPKNTTDQVVWSSADESIATVDPVTGKVKAIGAGETTITATAGDKTATCAVKVRSVIERLTIYPTSVALVVNETLELKVTVKPTSAIGDGVMWSSSDESVATVDQNGVVKAKTVGITTITATVGYKNVTCRVYVNEKIFKVAGVAIEPTELTLEKGQTGALTANISPANASNMSVKWSSDNPKIVTVDPKTGEVTAMDSGTATITVTTVDGGKTATCVVTVEAVVTGVTVEPETLTLIEGATKTLTATVLPEDAKDKTVTWSSSNPGIAKVDPQTGKVTGMGAGDATITATTVDGGKTASCVVKVEISIIEGYGDLHIIHKSNGVQVVAAKADGSVLNTTIANMSSNQKFRYHSKAASPAISFEFSLHDKITRPSSITPAAKTLVASDFHGQLGAFVAFLKGNGVVDSDLNWAYGTNNLIIQGDFLDRGRDDIGIGWLIYKLEQEAYDAGGRLDFINGNHEDLVPRNDLRYPHADVLAFATKAGITHDKFFGKDTEMGRWIRDRHLALTMGENLFVHAGLSLDLVNDNYTISEINSLARWIGTAPADRTASNARNAKLYDGTIGITWYREMVKDDRKLLAGSPPFPAPAVSSSATRSCSRSMSGTGDVSGR